MRGFPQKWNQDFKGKICRWRWKTVENFNPKIRMDDSS